MKIGIFGGGSIARKAYLPLLTAWPGVEISGIYSRTAETVAAAREKWHIPDGATQVDALIQRGIEAAFVLVATPAHYEIARALLAAGIDVYVEKPLTQTSQQAADLTHLAQQNGRILMVGYNRRYAPLFRQAKSLFAGHPVALCQVEKHRPSAFHPSLWNNYLDDTIHQIDLLRFYCPNPQPLSTYYEMKAGKLTTAVSLLRLAGGGLGAIHTCLEAGAWQENLTLHGDGLTVQVSAFRELRIRFEDHEEIYGTDRPGRWLPDLTERGFSGAIEHFFECVRTRAQPETNGEEALKTQELMEKLVAVADPPKL